MMIASLASAVVASVLTLGDSRTTWEPIIEPSGHLFPSVLLATSPMLGEAGRDPTVLGDGRMLVGAALSCTSAGERGTLTVECPDFIESSSIDFSMPTPGEEYWVFPVLRLKVDALQALHQQRPVTLLFKLSLNGETSQRTVPATLRSVNDCPFAAEIEGSEGGGTTMAPAMFAAYVNENHPYLDRLLKEALDTGIVGQFDGMQSGDPQNVILQVFAIWNVMQRKGLKYSNVTTVPSTAAGIMSQHVRLLDESIDNAQANCVDGSVLLASVLRKIDIEPMLVLVPGHCYLAFFADKEQTQLVGLETTMMGALDLRARGRSDASTSAVAGASGKEQSDEEFVVDLLGGLVSKVAKARGVKFDKKDADTAKAILDLIGDALDDDKKGDGDDKQDEGTQDKDGDSDTAGENGFDEQTLKSFETFIAAVQHATGELERNAEAFNDADNDKFHIVPVAEARAIGIMPIGYSAPSGAQPSAKPESATGDNAAKPKPASKESDVKPKPGLKKSRLAPAK
jgi:hypothetical protein